MALPPGARLGPYEIISPLGAGGMGEVYKTASFNEFHGRFSPDGRWLAIASDESGRLEVYVQPFPRSGGKWLVSTGGGSEPNWRGDGKELFYLAADRKLMAVTVRSGTTFESDAPRALFQTNVPYAGNAFRMNYDVTADGTRFLIQHACGGRRFISDQRGDELDGGFEEVRRGQVGRVGRVGQVGQVG